MSDFNPETRPGERWWEMLSLKPHCQGGQPYTPPPWYHDYTTQIELEKFKRGFIQFIGHPLVIVREKRYTVQEMAGFIGCKVDTFTLHLMRGAVRFKDLSWDVDLDEYSARVDAYKAKIMEDRRIKLEAAEAEKRASELRLLASRMANAERLRSMHQKRREAFYSQFTFKAREDKPGKLRILYVNGERSSKAEACKILGFGEVVLLKQLKKGDFTFNGISVEVRYSDQGGSRKLTGDAAEKKRIENRERARRRRASEPKIPRDRVAAAKITWEKRRAQPKPYTIQPYPEDFVMVSSVMMLTLNGEILEKGSEFKLLGFSRQKAQKLARQGIVTFENGNVIRYRNDISRRPYEQAPPFFCDNGKTKYGKIRWAVKISLGKGKKTTLFQSVDREKTEKYLADILVNEKWKSMLDKKQGLG